ncbi:WecB/TagA/CpsF family glycosyltransferase [Planctomycetes bacterium K23_9]|uniref:N-acetylmannosaminyltransferase n=1 Tax=Stieleria marina TaxID=1930275 RepID=A0A517NNT0_9BACT|nr:Putative N-acetylmannosaminyltransferase [Planctomycetes bacterium K23_9]
MSRVVNLIADAEKTNSVLSHDDKANVTATTQRKSCSTVLVMDIPITNITTEEVIDDVSSILSSAVNHPKMLFFANAHTMNLAANNPSYRAALRAADHVFGDGTGVRWAAGMRGVKLADNVNGTDLTPRLLSTRQPRTASYYLLGADPKTIHNAAHSAQKRFRNWRLAGFHHGYIQSDTETAAAIERINQVAPDMLLVGMGNPIQELWIQQNLDRLNVKVCIGVGGLFDFWSGNFSRAPQWLRRIGHEWLWRLWQQPVGKFSRYLIGNPLFLVRAFSSVKADGQRQTSPTPTSDQTPTPASRVDESHQQGAAHYPAGFDTLKTITSETGV